MATIPRLLQEFIGNAMIWQVLHGLPYTPYKSQQIKTSSMQLSVGHQRCNELHWHVRDSQTWACVMLLVIPSIRKLFNQVLVQDCLVYKDMKPLALIYKALTRIIMTSGVIAFQGILKTDYRKPCKGFWRYAAVWVEPSSYEKPSVQSTCFVTMDKFIKLIFSSTLCM